jgi:hypothetical protein
LPALHQRHPFIKVGMVRLDLDQLSVDLGESPIETPHGGHQGVQLLLDADKPAAICSSSSRSDSGLVGSSVI